MPAADVLTQGYSGLRKALEVNPGEQEMSTCRKGAESFCQPTKTEAEYYTRTSTAPYEDVSYIKHGSVWRFCSSVCIHGTVVNDCQTVWKFVQFLGGDIGDVQNLIS
jgi:hypothetical protein